MAVLVPFTNITLLGPVQQGAADVGPQQAITLRILPEVGLGFGLNGGSPTEKARPVLEAMVDVLGNVLPQVASLSQVDSLTKGPIAGTEILLSLELQASGFAYNKATEPVYFDLIFTPLTPLTDLALYGFSYENSLPGVWLPADLLTY